MSSAPTVPVPDDFVGRNRFFEAVASWWEDGAEPFFVLGGEAGAGKTSALAELAGRFPAVSAAHFCDPRDVSTRRPATAAGALARQLSTTVAGYGTALVDAASDARTTVTGDAAAGVVEPGGTNVGVLIATLIVNPSSEQEIWDRLMRRPLERLAASDGFRPVLVVIDALDEADRFDGTTISELVQGTGDGRLVRWLVSTRYLESFGRRLPEGSFRQWDLSGGDGGSETRADLDRFLRERLSALAADATPSELDGLTAAAAERSDGNFLYARLLVDTLLAAERPPTTDDVLGTPTGLDGVLGSYLTAIAQGDREVGWLAGYQPLLSVLSAAQEPLTRQQIQVVAGVTSAVTVHALARLSPLLDPGGDGSGTPSAKRFSLYHAAFREYLADPDRAGERWCDPAEAHERFVAAYRGATATWTAWSALDDYGVNHLLTHAASAGWSAERFDELLVPGLVTRLAGQPGAVAAVVRALHVPLSLALAEPDPARALLWSWASRSLRASLYELLSARTPVLLAKVGHADLALTALTLVDPADLNLPFLRRGLAETLAAEGDLVRARGLLSLAPPREHPALLVACATGTAARDPELALSLLDEARGAAGGADVVAPAPAGGLAVALAAVPAHADLAWQLAGEDREILEQVGIAVAAHSPGAALEAALRYDLPRAQVAACAHLAGAAPQAARKLLADPGLDHLTWSRAAITLALTGDPGVVGALREMTVDELTVAMGRSRPALLLLLAALRMTSPAVGEPDEADALVRELGNWGWFFIAAKHDVALIDSLDLSPLHGRSHAQGIAAAVVAHVARSLAGSEHDAMARSEDSSALGRLCAGLSILDPASGADVVAEMLPQDWLRRTEFLEGLVERLCPVAPDVAWNHAKNDRLASRRWAAALPADRLDDGIRLVLELDPKYSGSRAELAGLLATKLEPGNRDGAQVLLTLVTPTTGSVIFTGDRRILCAAFSGQEDDDPGTDPGAGDDLADDVARYAVMRRRSDVPALLWHELVSEGSAERREAPPSAAVAAREASLTARNTAVAVLARTAAVLLAEGGPDADGAAIDLLRQCLHPVYRPISAHVPRQPRIDRAVALAHRAWAGSRSADSGVRHFFDDVLVRATNTGGRALQQLSLALFESLDPAERAGLIGWASIRDEHAGPLLSVVDRARTESRGARDCEDDLGRLLGDDYSGYWPFLSALTGIARSDPAGAAELLRRPEHPSLAELFEIKDPDETLIELLPAIAAADAELAENLATEVCGRRPLDAIGRDALHATAVAVAGTDWVDGSRIAGSIDFDNVRGMALADLAAVAVADLPDEARRTAYSRILDDRAAEGDSTGADYVVRGVLDALRVDPHPDPRVVVRMIPPVFRKDTVDGTVWYQMADLACTIASVTDPARVLERLPATEEIIQSAWQL